MKQLFYLFAALTVAAAFTLVGKSANASRSSAPQRHVYQPVEEVEDSVLVLDSVAEYADDVFVVVDSVAEGPAYFGSGDIVEEVCEPDTFVVIDDREGSTLVDAVGSDVKLIVIPVQPAANSQLPKGVWYIDIMMRDGMCLMGLTAPEDFECARVSDQHVALGGFLNAEFTGGSEIFTTYIMPSLTFTVAGDNLTATWNQTGSVYHKFESVPHGLDKIGMFICRDGEEQVVFEVTAADLQAMLHRWIAEQDAEME